MFKKILTLLFISTLFLGCRTDEKQQVINAKGGVRYGGEFRFMSSEKVQTLFPLSTTNVYTNRVVYQIFQRLVGFDPETKELVPEIALSTDVNENSTVFTFHLRKDVYFHDDPCFEKGKGRLVTAHDFKYSLEFACSNHPLNHNSYLLRDKVLGADKFYRGEVDAVEGIRVIDDHTLEIELKSPSAAFKKIMTHTGLSVFPREAYEKYGNDIGLHPVGTGAFVLGEYTDDKIILNRNNNYWETDEFGNPLPFLDKVVMTYSKDKTDELLSFRAEKIDLVLDIPVEEIKNVLGTLAQAKAGENVKHRVYSLSSMSITYYGFSNQSEPFSNKNVRLAFNHAVNREAIINNWLEGEGWPALNGFVPKIIGYPNEKIKGYTYDVNKAQSLLAEAGYPEGEGFPTVKLYVNTLQGSGQHRLAEAVQKSLKENLNVNIEIELITIEEREKLVQSQDAIFWRTGWVADYPDPENFLNLFYSGNIDESNPTINPFKYNNPEFDALFEKAMGETNEEKRFELLAQCDQIIIDDAVVMPLMNDDFITMVNLKVRKFVTNEIEQLDFSTIYIKEVK
ncbi:MAG: ABC transporter substrate-binding protein [Brumimicrobium sp.]